MLLMKIHLIAQFKETQVLIQSIDKKKLVVLYLLVSISKLGFQDNCKTLKEEQKQEKETQTILMKQHQSKISDFESQFSSKKITFPVLNMMCLNV